MEGTDLHDRQFRWAVKLAVVVLIIAGLAWKAWHDTMADPVVRRATVFLPGLPSGTPPVTLALISDVHVAGPNMSPDRLGRVVAQVNALRPDVVVLAGDYVSDPSLGVTPYPDKVAVAPFGKLRAPLGVYAVIGNHERQRQHANVDNYLMELGITFLLNDARRAGPLAIGGLDEPVGGHARLAPTLAAMRRARLEGRMIGRAPLAVDRAALLRDRARGVKLTQLAKAYGISKASVCRIIKDASASVSQGFLPDASSSTDIKELTPPKTAA